MVQICKKSRLKPVNSYGNLNPTGRRNLPRRPWRVKVDQMREGRQLKDGLWKIEVNTKVG